MSVSVQDVIEARDRINGHVYRSPCAQSTYLSELLGAPTWCKLENLQATGSFKERGAWNRLLQLTDDEKRGGVICSSAGNHGQAVAFVGRALGVAATIVMPKYAPLIKVSNCRRFGATVILHGDTFNDARLFALEMAEREGLTFIPPFNDERIIAGAGTIGLEILEDVPDVGNVFVPVGGGGLLAGIATVLKARKPDVKLFGCESPSADTLYESMKAGHVTNKPTRPTLADGLAVAAVGELCFPIIQKAIEEVVLVEESAIASAILRLLEMEKTLVEGAGAISLAAALQVKEKLQGKPTVLMLCGGNIDVTVLSRIIDRGLRVDGRLCRIFAQISDRPGSLAKLLAVIAEAGASIKEVSHDRHFGSSDVAMVTVGIVMETQSFEHIAKVKAALTAAKIEMVTGPVD